MLNLYITFTIYFHTLPCIYLTYTLNAFKCIQLLPALCKPKVVNIRPPPPFPQWPLSLPGYHPLHFFPLYLYLRSLLIPSLQPDPSPHCSNCHPLQTNSFLPLLFLSLLQPCFPLPNTALVSCGSLFPVKQFSWISLAIIPPPPSPLL